MLYVINIKIEICALDSYDNCKIVEGITMSNVIN